MMTLYFQAVLLQVKERSPVLQTPANLLEAKIIALPFSSALFTVRRVRVRLLRFWGFAWEFLL